MRICDIAPTEIPMTVAQQRVKSSASTVQSIGPSSTRTPTRAVLTWELCSVADIPASRNPSMCTNGDQELPKKGAESGIRYTRRTDTRTTRLELPGGIQKLPSNFRRGRTRSSEMLLAVMNPYPSNLDQRCACVTEREQRQKRNQDHNHESHVGGTRGTRLRNRFATPMRKAEQARERGADDPGKKLSDQTARAIT